RGCRGRSRNARSFNRPRLAPRPRIRYGTTPDPARRRESASSGVHLFEERLRRVPGQQPRASPHRPCRSGAPIRRRSSSFLLYND
ncbi:unnamed protein product, partial [Ectocarpus sp. 12 AP-2014]